MRKFPTQLRLPARHATQAAPNTASGCNAWTCVIGLLHTIEEIEVAMHVPVLVVQYPRHAIALSTTCITVASHFDTAKLLLETLSHALYIYMLRYVHGARGVANAVGRGNVGGALVVSTSQDVAHKP